jgi:sugar diacid utilization regulator
VTGRRATGVELESRRVLGAQAAEQGLPLRALVDLYLSATWLSWSQLPGVGRASGMRQLRSVGEAVFRAVDGSIGALAEGYEAAQRLAIRQEEALRREFVEDLLHGRGDMGLLAERAERFGLRLAGGNVVAVAQAAVPFLPEDPAGRHLEAALLDRFHTRNVLLATKEGLLVCVAPAADDIPREFVRQLKAVLGTDADWRVGLGRAHPGPAGVVRSFEEARGALDLAARLGIDRRIARATDLLVFPVLLRDSAAITELVTAVLGPLRTARGGARPLLDTLATYFTCGGVATETARSLHIGVRTVGYRLERVRKLTGYRTEDALERYTLETAVLGARLLGWPEQEARPPVRP